MCAEVKFKSNCIELSYEGYGVAIYQGKRIFVPNFFPSEEAIIKITKIYSNYGYGVVESWIKQSLYRNKNHISTNSASLINLQYSEQLKWKEHYLNKLLTRNLNIDQKIIQPIIASHDVLHYRNKARYSLLIENQKVFYGEYLNKSKTLVKVSDFSLNKIKLNDILSFVLEKLNLIYQNKPDKVKFIKEITFRINGNNQVQILFSLHSDYDLPNKLINLLNENPFIVQLCVEKKNISKQIFKKEDFTISLFNKKFNLDTDNFFQVNLNVFEKILINIEKYLIKNHQNKTLIDAYCGVGVFSQIFNLYFNQLIGIEINQKSIKYAQSNAKLNQVNNVFYFDGKVENIINQKLISTKNSTLIIDPPRAGLDIKVINWIVKKNISEVIYLSCDPRTLTRDLKEFIVNGYEINQIIPFDMFPNTHHIETLVFLKNISLK
ncbi:Hypothetical RNA methyltransferase [Mycoplasmopsis citelli]|uniref:Hypothetical RNA methyltransferase n=2 Tax=Mycoplasmopsis citelli TaxID=171281 RepID=A0A449B268_9BACT|nr:Hypothetical RNA methyltransferase [Mycoplasmopsis citelli]